MNITTKTRLEDEPDRIAIICEICVDGNKIHETVIASSAYSHTPLFGAARNKVPKWERELYRAYFNGDIATLEELRSELGF